MTGLGDSPAAAHDDEENGPDASAARLAADVALDRPLAPTTGLPGWYPDWARELAELYFSGTTCVFVLHGNVHDYVYAEQDEGGDGTYGSLNEFLAQRLFGTWQVVFTYDLGRGLRLFSGRDKERYQEMVGYTQKMG